MSFAEAMLVGADLPADKSSRVIVKLAIQGNDAGLATKGCADILQDEINFGDNRPPSIKVVPDKITKSYLVDAALVSSNHMLVMEKVVQATQYVLLQSPEPLHISEAKAGPYVREADSGAAWEILSVSDDADITDEALAIAAEAELRFR